MSVRTADCFRSVCFCLATCMTAVVAPVTSAAADETLDLDSNKPSRMILHVCKADGTPLRPLVADAKMRDQFDRQGTPDVSADGKRVAFDAWSNDGGVWQDARIIVVDFDGKNARDISDGVMPCFSPDGKRLVVSRPGKQTKDEGAKGMSIWVMNIDGTEKKMIADQGAWGARWSGDGRTLVFHGGLDADGKKVNKNCLRVYDFESGETRNVFEPKESPFKQLSFHFDWAKGDKRLVAFGGQLKAGSSASAIVNVDEGVDSIEIIVDAEQNDLQMFHGTSMDWHPSSESILVTARQGRRTVLHLLPLDYEAETEQFDGLPDTVSVRDPIITPDGKHVIASLSAVR